MKNPVFVCLVAVSLCSCGVLLKGKKKQQVQEELAAMVKQDQIAAGIPQGEYKNLTPAQWDAFKDSTFTTHRKRINKLFTKYGFLGYKQVGKEGSQNFWLMVQHSDADPSFQKKILAAMDRAVKKKDANPAQFAYLTDRVAVNAGEQQVFGTQVTYEVNTTGRAIPKIGLIDSVNVDVRRKEYELGPLKDYLNMMTESHYEMNKERYVRMGILSPRLY
ncbi:MAG: hypothetical protein EOO88_55030 [Pedobacter sp.]|nr:MAG: hypothetical protein EOO88_55030 [Pedobacter sp.]